MGDVPTYVLERVFDAPRELAWRAWTEPDLVARWYGPNVETINHRHELKPGGVWLCEMRWGGNSHYQKAEFTEVSAPERLVWLHSNTDAEWNVAPSPMMPNWPLVLLTTVTFAQEEGHTRMRLTWAPHEASEAELAAFGSALGGLDRGWGAGMELLKGLLAELQASGE